MERQLTERRSAGQLEHFQRAAELLKTIRRLCVGASPALSVGRVLDAVSDADRRRTLQTLLMAAAPSHGATATLLDVWGGRWDRRASEQMGRRSSKSYELPADVGPPRSLQASEWDGHPVWLIGCRAGVQIVGASDQRVIATLHDREITSPRGFGAVACCGERHRDRMPQRGAASFAGASINPRCRHGRAVQPMANSRGTCASSDHYASPTARAKASSC
jgi:hypothetical protein